MRSRIAAPWRLDPYAPLLVPAGIVAATLVVLLILGPAPAGPTAGSATWRSSVDFSNRVLDVSWSPPGPSLVATPANATLPFGLNVSFREIDEYRGTGQILARANLVKADWSVTNSSSPAGLAREYVTHVPEQRTNGSGVLGYAAFYVNLTLFAGSAVTGSSASSLRIDVSLANWTPVHPVDSLSMSLPIAPRDGAIEHLAAGPAYTMECVPNDTSTASEYLRWDPSASLVNSSGGASIVSTGAQVAGTPALSTLSVAFDRAFGGELRYGFDLGLAAPVSAPRVPLLWGLTGAALAAGGSIGVFALTLRARSRTEPTAPD